MRIEFIDMLFICALVLENSLFASSVAPPSIAMASVHFRAVAIKPMRFGRVASKAAATHVIA